ncbi:MAG: hypothetical protein ABSE46_19545 [Terracidiphilus sp.]
MAVAGVAVPLYENRRLAPDIVAGKLGILDRLGIIHNDMDFDSAERDTGNRLPSA